jgi:hypothetical protein
MAASKELLTVSGSVNLETAVNEGHFVEPERAALIDDGGIPKNHILEENVVDYRTLGRRA